MDKRIEEIRKQYDMGSIFRKRIQDDVAYLIAALEVATHERDKKEFFRKNYYDLWEKEIGRRKAFEARCSEWKDRCKEEAGRVLSHAKVINDLQQKCTALHVEISDLRVQSAESHENELRDRLERAINANEVWQKKCADLEATVDKRGGIILTLEVERDKYSNELAELQCKYETIRIEGSRFQERLAKVHIEKEYIEKRLAMAIAKRDSLEFWFKKDDNELIERITNLEAQLVEAQESHKARKNEELYDKICTLRRQLIEAQQAIQIAHWELPDDVSSAKGTLDSYMNANQLDEW